MRRWIAARAASRRLRAEEADASSTNDMFGRMQRPKGAHALIEGFLSAPGEISRETRLAVMRRAEALAKGRAGEEAGVPAGAAEYLEKVAHQAHRVTDHDIVTLKTAGYSEDAIFELTFASAAGASLARLDAALALLEDKP
jgi:alkylhydroperoxidase family enzyme